MRTILWLLITLGLYTSVSEADDEDLLPLDTRTRCVVLFRECLLDIADKDAEAIFRKIADGSGRSFRIYKSPTALSPDLKRELQDHEKFFKRNFPHSTEITRSFDRIRFSSLKTRKEAVAVRNGDDASTQKGKLHVINVKIPEIEKQEFRNIRFIEIADKLYWVPFGW